MISAYIDTLDVFRIHFNEFEDLYLQVMKQKWQGRGQEKESLNRKIYFLYLSPNLSSQDKSVFVLMNFVSNSLMLSFLIFPTASKVSMFNA